MPTLKLFLLGATRVELDGQPIVISRRKALALLAYLAVEGQAHSRDALAALLWPEYEPGQSYAYLRRAIWEINKTLGKGWLDAGRDQVGPGDQILWLDVAAFEAALAGRQREGSPADNLEQLAAAVTLYQGDFMAGFSLADAPQFDTWQRFTAERLRRLFSQALERLVGGLEARADFEPAIDYAGRWLALDELHEPAHRALMRLYAATGQRAAAIRQYETAAAILDKELGLTPEAETIALYEQIALGQWPAEADVGATTKSAPAGSRPAPERDLPSGTITFLFTDIEGSTLLLRRLGEEYVALLAEHHRLLREIIARWHGTEVATDGDSFFVSFPRATDAISAVIEAQRTLANHHWPNQETVRVRMGLHTGEAWASPEEGYVGMDVHRAARIGDAGHGGQVLLSETTAALLRTSLPQGATLVDLGHYRLKDMGRAEPIVQLTIEGLPAEFPALKAERVSVTMKPAAPRAVVLPQYTTPLVGREDEIATIGRYLLDPGCRLLTLVGLGGIGKTRLAIEAASAHRRIFPDGVFFVSLPAASSADGIVRKVGGAIGYEFSAGSEPDVQLQQALQAKEALLILDNLEHLLAFGGLISDLLSATSRLKVLVTSRESLNLSDEWLFHVEGLPFPGPESDQDAERYASVQLFAEHAGRVRRDFALADEKEAVAHICRLVRGMPLGIELAAKWRRRLPSNEIARELQRNLDMLATDMRDVPDRHRSMRAVFDHSWHLLTDDERRVLSALSVFQGGFRRDAAEEVVSAALAVLMSLVDKSLLRVSRDGRFEIHELQRQYAGERLDESPELKTEIHARHSAYYTRFIDRPIGDFLNAGNQETLRAIDAEIDNFRSAWDWAVEQRQLSNLDQAIQGLYWYTWMRSWHEEGERAFREVVEVLRDAEPTADNKSALARALTSQGAMDIWLGRPARAAERAQESIGIARSLNAQKELAAALNIRGWAALAQGESQQARALLEEAVVQYEAVNSRDQMEVKAFAFGLLGHIARYEGDAAGSEHWYQRALRLGREIDDQRTIADALGSLGRLAFWQGQYQQARQFCQESLIVAKAAEIAPLTIGALHTLGEIARATGEITEAQAHVEESLRVAKDDGKGPSIAGSLVFLGEIRIAQGDDAAAQELFRQAMEIPPGVADRRRYAAVLNGLGRIALRSGDYAEARRQHQASLAIHREISLRTGILDNLVILTRIALGQGHDGESVARLKEALQEAIQDSAPPGILQVFAIAAELRLRQDDRAEAVRLATLVAQHPASDAESRDLARALLDKPEVEPLVKSPAAIDWDDGQNDLEDMAAELLEQLSSSPEQALNEGLSERELEVLQLVAAGKSNREIAEELVLAVGTVKSHLHNILQKLDASSRIQAVARARELKLL